MRPDGPRDPTAGPASGPQPPFPIRINGKVIKGFGRGSKELGIPTANIPVDGLSIGGHEDVASGVYFGWAGLDFVRTEGDAEAGKDHEGASRNADVGEAAVESGGRHDDDDVREASGRVFPMVMSIGWNPFYKNTVRSVEVHILHSFPSDFYGSHLYLVILGYIRPEYDYSSVEALIDDINMDVEVARRSLDRPAYEAYKREDYLVGKASGQGVVDVVS